MGQMIFLYIWDTVITLINVPALINTPCHFSKNNSVLTLMNSCLLHLV